jgi:hypothetical protein
MPNRLDLGKGFLFVFLGQSKEGGAAPQLDDAEQLENGSSRPGSPERKLLRLAPVDCGWRGSIPGPVGQRRSVSKRAMTGTKSVMIAGPADGFMARTAG